MPVLPLNLLEWQELTPDDDPELKGTSLGDNRAVRDLARHLTQNGMLEILELRGGLTLRATSFIGRIRLGDLLITIHPKIQLDVLLNLFRYAYNLRNLNLFEVAEHSALPEAFQDLLISQLAAEVSELLVRGLHRQYAPLHDMLPVPRGRIDMQQLARQGGIREAAMPCTYYPRMEDRLVNQVLLAGVQLAVRLTSDLVLRARLRRLAAILGENIAPISLNASVMRRLDRELSRLTAAYEPALTLIGLLMESAGLTIEDESTAFALPGFLFDMNRFFETLMSQFLHDNLPGYEVHDQFKLHGMMAYAAGYNPKRRQPPVPRPDYVVTRGGTLVAMLDAKYRDIWEKDLPRDMLYQLAMYALSQGDGGRATILYPTVNPLAKPEAIDIREIFHGEHRGQVVLRPVNLLELERLIAATGVHAQRERSRLAASLLTIN